MGTQNSVKSQHFHVILVLQVGAL